MAFEVFKKSSAPISKVPTVTIQRKGIMSLNRAAHALIGSPDFVELLWDADRRIVGLRAAEESNPNAYPARPQNTKSDAGPILVAGSVFTRHYNIPTTESRRWVVSVDDDILMVELDKESQLATSNRNSRTAKGDAADG